MEKFKEEAYLREYNEVMRIAKPSSDDLSKLAKHLSALQATADNLFVALRDSLSSTKVINELDKKSGIRVALSELGLIEETETILVWQYPDDIDKLELPYLLNHWEDVWYPPSDEAVCLYFPLVDKLIMITDYGSIYY